MDYPITKAVRRNWFRYALITATLCCIFAFTPPVMATQTAQKAPHPEMALWAFVIVVVIAAIVIATIFKILWNLIKKIPTQKKDDDPDDPKPGQPTNSVPKTPAFTGAAPKTLELTCSPASHGAPTNADFSAGVEWYDVRGSTNHAPWETLMVAGLQSSSDTKTWTPECYIIGWAMRDLTNGLILIGVYDTNWVRIATRFGDTQTNFVHDLGAVLPVRWDQSRFYRSFVPEKLHN